jgi:hypothetical protein
MVEKRDIRNYTIRELEQLIDKYPWFALARIEYFSRMLALGKGTFEALSKSVALYIPYREKLNKIYRNKSHRIENNTIELELINLPKITTSANRTRRSAYGDYFAPADYSVLKENGGILANNIFKAPKRDNEICEPYIPSNDLYHDDEDNIIYTETAAEVYLEQGFKKEAITIYNKLILLYPEKNSYFASLIEKININN